jgi:hypothetical protein
MIYLIFLIIISTFIVISLGTIKGFASVTTMFVTFLCFLLMCCLIIGYTNYISETRAAYTEISSQELSMLLSGDNTAHTYVGKNFIVSGKVDDISQFENDYMTVLNCDKYPQIYVKNCIRTINSKVSIKCKVVKYDTLFICIAE